MNDYQTAISILERVWETAKRSQQEQPDFSFIRQCVEDLPTNYYVSFNGKGNLMLDFARLKDDMSIVSHQPGLKIDSKKDPALAWIQEDVENITATDCNKF